MMESQKFALVTSKVGNPTNRQLTCILTHYPRSSLQIEAQFNSLLTPPLEYSSRKQKQ
jgi:hypothetical protein